ncbi:MAG TPA: adenosylcobinamide-GDP ribazoletransferase [Chloroflexota bacterium]|nr:adenosylcobinamide-GDP ribazoletransferase [Chloroflexota bacterium]
MIRAFLAALDFLTVWHLPWPKQPDAPDRGRSLYFFGFIGLLIGGLLVVIDFVSRPWPSAIGSVLILAGLLLATGGLHFDGLLDTCDGVFSKSTPKARLEVMRDSHSGAFAIAAGVLDLLLWWACSVDLTGAHHYTALLLMATTSRCSMVLAVTLFPYARPAGLGKDFRDERGRWAGIVNVVLAFAVGYALLGLPGLFGAAAGLASAILTGMYLMTRLPGLTGDCYGAVNEIAQIATLFALVPLLS